MTAPLRACSARPAALALAAVLALGACSLDLVDDASPGAARSTDPADDTVSDPATGSSDPATGSSDPATGSSDPATGSSDPAFDRAAMEAAATKYLTCGGGELELTTASDVVVVTDNCGVLRVGAAGVVVVAQDVDELVVNAAGTQVLVHEAGTLTVAGADNRVGYETGTPTVSETGAGNEIREVRS